MDYKQILVEDITSEELDSELKPIFEKLVHSVVPSVKRIIYVTEDHLQSLHSYIRGIICKEFVEAGEFVEADFVKDGEGRYPEFISRLKGIVETNLIVVESKDTHYKWLSVISKSQSAAALIEFSDKDLMIVFSNLGRTLKKWNMTLHIPSEEREDMLSAIDLHFNKDKQEVSFTNCKLGAPILEVYVSAKIEVEDPETKEKGEQIGVHVLKIAYGDPGSMYHDIILQLSNFSKFENISLAIRRYQEDNPQVMEVNSLEELKDMTFGLQAQMGWYGILESSQQTKK